MPFRIMILLLLGKMTGPIIKDGFVAVMPLIEKSLSFGTVGSVFMVNLPLFGGGLCQLFFGEFIDKFGRKLGFIISELCIIVASLIIIFSSNVFIVMIARTLQGISNIGSSLIMYAIVADIFTGKSSRISQGYAVLKVASLLFSSGIPYLIMYMMSGPSDWKALLWLLIVIKTIYAILLIWSLPETVNTDHIAKFKQIKELFPICMRNKQYVLPLILATLCYMWIYSYFNMLGLFRKTQYLFANTHAINLIAAATAGMLNIYLIQKKYQIKNIIYHGAILTLVGAILNMLVTIFFDIESITTLYLLALCSSVMSFAITFITSNSMAMASTCYPKNTGVAISNFVAIKYITASSFIMFSGSFSYFFAIQNVMAVVMLGIGIALVITAKKFINLQL